MDTFSFLCPGCQKRYSADESLIGKTGRCKQCDHMFVVPEAGMPKPPPPLPPPPPPAPQEAEAVPLPRSLFKKAYGVVSRAAQETWEALPSPPPPLPPPPPTPPPGPYDYALRAISRADGVVIILTSLGALGCVIASFAFFDKAPAIGFAMLGAAVGLVAQSLLVLALLAVAEVVVMAATDLREIRTLLKVQRTPDAEKSSSGPAPGAQQSPPGGE